MMRAFARSRTGCTGPMFLAPATQSHAGEPIEVDIYKGDVATVNSYIFSNGVSLIVMDVQRATSEAKKSR